MKAKTEKIIKVGIIVVLSGIGAYILVKKVRQGIARSKLNLPTNTGNGGGNTELSANTFPLQKGSRGAEVETLQKFLNKKVTTMLTQNPHLTETIELLEVDGIFGDKTEKLLEKISGSKIFTKAQYDKIKL